ncbi:purine-nucleoside phosphorylase [bacterium]|nr:purine-nucleoside phosphorylase [bacterium]
MDTSYKIRVDQSAEFLKKWNTNAPDLCLVLGSGLGNAIPGIDSMPALKFSEIPGFRSSEVVGHASELRVGNVNATHPATGKSITRKIAFLRGRNHAYEGFTAGDVVHNVRAMIAWGVKGIILTNAAGCLETSWNLGDFMLIEDHINLSGLNPLSGLPGNGFGQRFCDMTQCYDPAWGKVFLESAAALGVNLHRGTYAGVLGPSYETPAEIRMLRTLGAQAVGMSTVLEAIAARQMGARVVGLSCMTNYGAGLLGAETRLDHSDVVHMGASVAKTMAELVLGTALGLAFAHSSEH